MATEPKGLDEFLNDTEMFAEGGEVGSNEPKGLDSFLSAPVEVAPSAQITAPQSPQQPLSDEPAGLDDFVAPEMTAIEHGGGHEQFKALVEGFGRGTAGPLATFGEELAGIPKEDILGRQEANPITAGVGEVAGLASGLLYGGTEARGLAKLGSLTLGAQAAKYGSKAAELLGLGGEGATLASKIGGEAANNAIQSALITSSDKISDMLLNDPNTSANSAIADVGLSGLLGAGIGGALGSVSPLFNAMTGHKVSQFVEDFKGRFHDHIINPNPVDAVKDELQNHYTKISTIADSVYGPAGIKAQEVAKAVPELNDAILGQADVTASRLQLELDKMLEKPNRYPSRLVSRLQEDLSEYSAATNTAQSSADIFNATQDLKTKIQGYAKFDKFFKPVDEAYDFVNSAKKLGHELRTSLEDNAVWGKAAERQKAINSAFTEYLPAIKDFEKKFTTEVGGDRVIDPTKINTYMSQLGKPNAELKQQMLKNYLDASEKYAQVVNQSHVNLGLEAPDMYSPLNVTTGTLGKKTAGAKLADIIVDKGLKDVSGKALGAAAGVGIGHATGIPGSEFVGALIGEHALGPFFKHVLGGLARPILESMGNSAGVKGAADYALAVARGQHSVDKAAKALFSSTKAVISANSIPDHKDRVKLDKKLAEYQVDPEKLASLGGHVASILPDHASALGTVAAQAVTYLNSLRPNKEPASPLDNKPVPSAVENAKYNNALNIAMHPLMVLDKVKSGAVTLDDVTAIRTMFPDLYQSLSKSVMDSLMDHAHKEESVPYKLKSGLAIFLGQPLDSTMQPMSIQSAQEVNGPPAPAPGPQQAPEGGKKPGSTKSLTKLPSAYSTPAQAAEADQSKR